MAVTPADLLAPAGPVEETLFPGEGDGDAATPLYTRLAAYIGQAEAKIVGVAFPDPDPATKAWALHLTFEAAYRVAVSRPATENSMVAVIGSHGYAKDQRDALKAEARKWKEEFFNLYASVPTTPVPLGPGSRQTRIIYEW